MEEKRKVYCRTIINHEHEANNVVMLSRCLTFAAGMAELLPESEELLVCKVRLTPESDTPSFIEVTIDMTSESSIDATKELMLEIVNATPCVAELWLEEKEEE